MSLIYQELEKDVRARINAIFPIEDSFINVQPGEIMLPRKYADLGEPIRALPTYKDDIWLVSYPRAGSTRLQELIWLLGNNLDFKREQENILLRAPIIELTALFRQDHNDWLENTVGGSTVDIVRNMTRPRFARSHLPWNLLPQGFDTIKPKIIYIARNPKDICVSLYHYLRTLHGMQSSFEYFANLFLEGHVPMGPFWRHVLPFWKRSRDPNILFLKYEDMNRDLARTIRKCARFLDVEELVNDENIKRITDHLKFENMKTNDSLNASSVIFNNNDNGYRNSVEETEKFIRKGRVGDWQNYMDDELSQRFDEWIDKNSKGSGLVFEYE